MNNNWIKSTDRLPDKCGMYLTAVCQRFSTAKWFDKDVMYFNPYEGYFTSIDDSHNLKEYDLVYWMPLPEDPEEFNRS